MGLGASGVPEISPVFGFITIPAGRAGEILKLL
jgi:hypothetical protein